MFNGEFFYNKTGLTQYNRSSHAYCFFFQFFSRIVKKHSRGNKKTFFDNIDLLQIICAYCQINDSQNTRQVEFDKLISYVKVKNEYDFYF